MKMKMKMRKREGVVVLMMKKLVCNVIMIILVIQEIEKDFTNEKQKL